MKSESTADSKSGRKLIILGFVTIGILFLLYSRYQDPELITPDAFDSIQRIAYGFYIILLACFGAITYGLYIFHKAKVERKEKDLFTIIAITTWNPKSRKIFLATFVGYGIFFSLVSGTLVYQPEVNFSIHYGAEIPSGFVAPCCDGPGYMPKVIIYLTEHVAISRKDRSVSSIGAATGLFIACPTCAGTFLSIFIGTASGIALTVALTQLQTLFIAISIPILLIIPFIMAKKLRNADGSCKVDPTL
jgi:hypothetical protein